MSGRCVRKGGWLSYVAPFRQDRGAAGFEVLVTGPVVDAAGAWFAGGVSGQGVSVVGVLRRDQLLGTGKLPWMTRVTTTLGECGSVIPCCLGPRTNR